MITRVSKTRRIPPSNKISLTNRPMKRIRIRLTQERVGFHSIKSPIACCFTRISTKVTRLKYFLKMRHPPQQFPLPSYHRRSNRQLKRGRLYLPQLNRGSQIIFILMHLSPKLFDLKKFLPLPMSTVSRNKRAQSNLSQR